MEVTNFSDSLIWIDTQQKLGEGGTKNYRSYQILKNEAGYFMSFFEVLTQVALGTLASRVNDRLKKLTIEHWIYPVPYEQVLYRNSDVFDENKNVGPDIKLVEFFEAKCGLEQEKQRELLEKVVGYVKSFFSKLPQNITQENVGTIIQEWQREAIGEKIALRDQLFGIKTVQ